MNTNDNRDFVQRCSSAHCRSCGHSGLKPILDLGMMPYTDGYLTVAQLAEPEPFSLLELAFCPECSLVQILETVAPEKLFDADYHYFSSVSDQWLAHARANALAAIERYHLDATSFVVELASNDGYLLKNYVEKGIPCLGIDPARGTVEAALKIGVPTKCAFFTYDLALELIQEKGGPFADIVHGNNVLAHVADTNGFVRGIRAILKDRGAAVIEAPYLRDLVEHIEFDTIYHEHLCYFSVTALDKLFRRNYLFLNDVQKLTTHGGSLRLFVEPYENTQHSVITMLQEEKRIGMDTYEYYKDFSLKVKRLTSTLKEMLLNLKAQGKRVVAYGAAAKGAIMLNYIQAGADLLEYVVDRNIHKQGKLMPGIHIPITGPERLLQDMPDYVLILPWNFKDEILQQQAAFRQKGGKFIIPVPEPEIV
jgi:2-polyprenyl-3-methyl-5-hydroxy-6-metoxy-1,4-benzoquinol methylase